MSKLSDKILHNTPIQLSSYHKITESIFRNIQNILNTRSSIGLNIYIKEHTLFDHTNFGLPDFSFVSFHSDNDKKKLCRAIKIGITQFENRLSDVEVIFSRFDALKKIVEIKVTANLVKDGLGMSLLLNLNRWEFSVHEWERNQ